MARHNLTRLRSLAIGLAVVSLGFAACSKSNGSGPVPVPSATAFPTASGSPSALSSPCASTLGLAYEPDGGNGGAFQGVQVTHFEDNLGNLCGAVTAPNVVPPGVAFAAPVGSIAFASDLSDAVALLRNGAGTYTLAQDIFGASVGSIVPVGPVYDLSANPPTPAPVPSSSASAPPVTAPLLVDASSIAILGSSSLAVALTTGSFTAASTPSIVALTSLTNAPPQYGQSVPYSGSTYTLKSIPQNPRSIVRIGVDTRGNIVALARGPQDLLAFAVTSGFLFDAQSVDTTLGTGAALRGSGAIAIDPIDSTRALVGGMSGAGQGMMLTLVTGLPKAITKSSTIALPGNVNSIAIAPSGTIGVVGTDAGITVVTGIATGTLSVLSTTVPSYRACTGSAANLTNIASIGLSADTKYLVALGTTAGLTCASGYNASIFAMPFNSVTGTVPTPAPTVAPSPGTSPSPVPTSFVQNNVIAPPPGADYLFVH